MNIDQPFHLKTNLIMTVVCYDARFCVGACVSKRGWCVTTQYLASLRVFQKQVGVLRCKVLHRCVCFKNGLVYYDARYCVAACVSKTGWCITMQDFASLRVFQKGLVCYDARFCVAACVSKGVGVLRRKILRRCFI